MGSRVSCHGFCVVVVVVLFCYVVATLVLLAVCCRSCFGGFVVSVPWSMGFEINGFGCQWVLRSLGYVV